MGSFDKSVRGGKYSLFKPDNLRNGGNLDTHVHDLILPEMTKIMARPWVSIFFLSKWKFTLRERSKTVKSSRGEGPASDKFEMVWDSIQWIRCNDT